MEFFRKNCLSYNMDEAAKIMSDAENIRWSKDDAKQAIGEFIRMGKLKSSKNQLWKNKLSILSASSAVARHGWHRH
jgi:hypothetical protein